MFAVSLYSGSVKVLYRFPVGVFCRKAGNRFVNWFFRRKPAHRVMEYVFRVLFGVFVQTLPYPVVDWSLRRYELEDGQGASTSSSHRQGATTIPSGRRAQTCSPTAKGHPR